MSVTDSKNRDSKKQIHLHLEYTGTTSNAKHTAEIHVKRQHVANQRGTLQMSPTHAADAITLLPVLHNGLETDNWMHTPQSRTTCFCNH